MKNNRAKDARPEYARPEYARPEYTHRGYTCPAYTHRGFFIVFRQLALACLSALSLSLAAGAQSPQTSPPETGSPETESAETESAETEVEEIRVSARLPLTNNGQSQVVVDLDAAVAGRLDDVVAAVPGVSLFRRANSLSAHPTIQGLTMRGVGGSGAGRVLVTLDGVPLNDPFGGWINWTALAAETLGRVTVQAGGGAGAFGAQALAGSLRLSSSDETGGYARLGVGSFASATVAGGVSLALGKGRFRLDAGHEESDGFVLLRPADRGPIDRAAAASVTRISGRAGVSLGRTDIVVAARYFLEQRLGGFDNAPNRTGGMDASLRLVSRFSPNHGSELLFYVRDRTFRNIFVAARENRTVGRPVLDQTAVPGIGYGFLARARLAAIEIGLDGQWLDGETRERFRNLGAGFTRSRTAGGSQGQIGAYLQTDWSGDRTSLSAVIRLDGYGVFDGRRRERDRADGSVLLDQAFAPLSGLVPSGRVGAVYRLAPTLNWRGNVYRSWRLPTLNEYFRPFRVGNDITEANAALRAETLWGLDSGVTWQPGSSLTLDLLYFRSWLENGVGNITLGPGLFMPGGFVSAGGSLRQRSPVDLTVTDGVEAAATVKPAEGWQIIARYQGTVTRISAFAAQPGLVRNRPAQTAPHRFYVRLTHTRRWGGVSLEARYTSHQFDDDQNRRRLPPAFTVNGRIRLTPPDSTVVLTAAVENLFDEEVQSARSASGLVTLAQPRFFRLEVMVRF